MKNKIFIADLSSTSKNIDGKAGFFLQKNKELIYGISEDTNGDIVHQVLGNQELIFKRGGISFNPFDNVNNVAGTIVSADWDATSGVTAILNRPTDDQVIDWTVSQAGNSKIIHPDNYTGGTGSQLTTEEVQDIVGTMVTGGTQTNISVTYNDTTGKLEFVANAGGGGSSGIDAVLDIDNNTDDEIIFSGASLFTSNRTGRKSWQFRSPDNNLFEIVPSTSINGSDWNESAKIILQDDGGITATSFNGNWNGNPSSAFLRFMSSNANTFAQDLSIGRTSGNTTWTVATNGTTTENTNQTVNHIQTWNRLSINPLGNDVLFGKGYGEPNGGATIQSNGNFFTDGLVYASTFVKDGGDGTNVLLDDGTTTPLSGLGGGGGGSANDMSAVSTNFIPWKTGATTWGNSGLSADTVRITSNKSFLIANGSNYVELAVRRSITSTSKTWSQKLVVGNPTGELQFSNVNETDGVTNVFRVGGSGNAFSITFGTGDTWDVLHEGNMGTFETKYSKVQYFETKDLTDSTTIAWDCLNNQVCKVTLGGNRFLSPSNLRNGAIYVLIVQQDATGNRTLGLTGSIFEFGDDGAPTLSTGAGLFDVLNFYSDGNKLYFTGIKKGFDSTPPV